MTPQDNGESILLEAQRLTHGDRNANYGHPLDDYSRTAALMSALLHHKLTEPLTPEEAAMCMCAVKLSRHAHRPKRDNMVDLAGYAWVVWACTEEGERRNAALCQDEGCPHYGRPHVHVKAPAPLEAGPLEPEGFPDGYSSEQRPVQANHVSIDALPTPTVRGDTLMTETDLHLASQAAGGPLKLDCGCVKRCKGHPVSLDAAKVDVPASPGNYAAERAAGPKDPQGRPYASTTADAEFPHPPPVHRPVEAAREFDPAD